MLVLALSEIDSLKERGSMVEGRTVSSNRHCRLHIFGKVTSYIRPESTTKHERFATGHKLRSKENWLPHAQGRWRYSEYHWQAQDRASPVMEISISGLTTIIRACPGYNS